MLFIDKNSSVLSYASVIGQSYPLIRQIDECSINIDKCASVDDTWKTICIKEYDFLLISFNHTDSPRIIKLIRNASRMIRLYSRKTKIIAVGEELNEWKKRVLIAGTDIFLISNAEIKALENDIGFIINTPPSPITLINDSLATPKIQQMVDLGHFYFDLLERNIITKETKGTHQLTPNEARLFCILYNQSPNLVSHEILYQALYYKSDNALHMLNVLITTLRKKVDIINGKINVIKYCGVQIEFDIAE